MRPSPGLSQHDMLPRAGAGPGHPPVQVVDEVSHVIWQDDSVLTHVSVVAQHAHRHVGWHFGKLPEDVVEGPAGGRVPQPQLHHPQGIARTGAALTSKTRLPRARITVGGLWRGQQALQRCGLQPCHLLSAGTHLCTPVRVPHSPAFPCPCPYKNASSVAHFLHHPEGTHYGWLVSASGMHHSQAAARPHLPVHWALGHPC